MEPNDSTSQEQSTLPEEMKQDLIKKQQMKHSINKEFDYYQIKVQYAQMAKDGERKEKFEVVQRELTPQISEFLTKAFMSHFIGNDRSEKEAEAIVQTMFCVSVAKGVYLFKEGDKPQNFYIIEQGSFEASRKKKTSKTSWNEVDSLEPDQPSMTPSVNPTSWLKKTAFFGRCPSRCIGR